MIMVEIQITVIQEDKDDVMSEVLEEVKGKSPEQLLAESGQTNQVPVNIEVILENCGIKAIPTSFEALESTPELANQGEILGLLLVHGEDVGLFYKASDTEHRQRFTMAHELGHYCIHYGDAIKDSSYIEFRNNMNGGEKKEIEANTFAGEILIPEPSLRNIINRLLKPTLQGLADIFDVSVSVMRARLEYLMIPYYDDKLQKIIVPE